MRDLGTCMQKRPMQEASQARRAGSRRASCAAYVVGVAVNKLACRLILGRSLGLVGNKLAYRLVLGYSLNLGPDDGPRLGLRGWAQNKNGLTRKKKAQNNK